MRPRGITMLVHAALLAGVALAERGGGPAPIIGGSGNYTYQYMPDLVAMPVGTDPADCHGLEVDDDANIYLTSLRPASPV